MKCKVGGDGPGLDVALISMPFVSYKQPSLGLSLLKAELARKGISARVFYFTIRMAEEIGDWLYDKIATWHIVDLLGDWVFAEAAFGTDSGPETYVRDVLNGLSPAHNLQHFGKEPLPEVVVEEILKVRAAAPEFLDRCAEEVLAFSPRVVGFTSVFHQQVASLALAQRLKQSAPGTFVVMGGPNCRGIMGAEAVRQFPFLDAVVTGEGEVIFPEMVVRLCRGESVSGMPGVCTRPDSSVRDEGAPQAAPGYDGAAPTFDNLDLLPFPDHSDFLEQWRGSTVGKKAGRVLFETSRGCWWGQRNRCTFCGQASESLVYRKKSISRAVDELTLMSKSLPDFSVCVTDEVVDRKMLKGLAQGLLSAGVQPDIVYVQVRPDLSKDELRLLHRAGVRRVEAGVESFSTRVLTLMRKGTTGLQNIAFLKWCREVGVEPVWNLLWGFPGEPPEAYQAMAALVPLLVHLHPPNYVGPFRLDRFSPYFEQAADFGLEEVRPYPAYRYVYPFPPAVLDNLACYFTFRYRRPQDVGSYTGDLAEAVAIWKEVHSRVRLYAVDRGDRLLVVD
ncbi:MAG TPA: RiPP maturation radical SAM protein 1, partial [Firmicutes bacterium]|nr:RiPP maturation radical SAM protein 1 [Bacillota bacterium]